MKKFSIKIKGLILVILSLFLVNCFSEEKCDLQLNDVAVTYYYETSTSYLDNLGTEELETAYNLADFYPLISENQTSSSYCWIYSSMKSLESAFMVQMGEYYNFSEIGLAYTMLMYDTKNGVKYPDEDGRYVLDPYFDCSGTYEKFVSAYQNCGLIFESDVSNDIFAEIKSQDKENMEYYSYINNYTTKELNSYIKPYEICGINTYSNYREDYNSKKEIIKRFIKTYGAVFTGIQGGSTKGGFFKEDNESTTSAGVNYFYEYDRTNSTVTDYVPLTGNHAVTIIGWNDEVVFSSERGGFLAMNSWGFEDGQVSYFYIPYSYTYLYSTVSGFICEEPEEPEIKLVGSSDSSFTTDILTGSKELDNYFCYDDEISLTYRLNLTSLENVKIKVSGGNKDYTGRFTISYNNGNGTAKITLNKDTEFYGGYYTISFYNSDELLGRRSLYVYSGTEIGRLFIFSQEVSVDYDNYELNNTFLNNNSTATINVAGPADYYFIEMSLAPISSYTRLKDCENISYKEFIMTVSDISVICSSNTTLENYAENTLKNYLFIQNTNNFLANSFVYQIGISNRLKLSTFQNCLIRFKFTINSVIYDNCARDFYINMFVSNDANARSYELNEIIYVLDDGENDVRNLTKYPDYTKLTTSTMTSVELFSPTKTGYNFIGWYLDAEYTQNVTIIDSNLSGDITLYAKWDSTGADYFDIELSLQEIVGKNLTDGIIYGDTIKIKLAFTEKEALNGNSYSINYFFYCGDGILTGDKSDLTRDTSTNLTGFFTLDYTQLASGTYTFKIKVIVDIGSLSTYKETTLRLNVAKKELRFSFSELEKPYNGKVQKPKVQMVSGYDFYENDKLKGQSEEKSQEELFVLYCEKTSKDVGVYTYSISKVLNNNYYFTSDYSTCSFEITALEIEVEWQEYSHTYDGTSCFPTLEILNKIDGDSITFEFIDVNTGKVLSELKNAGTYVVNIEPTSISNRNYTVGNSLENFTIEILPVKVQVILQSTTDRVQTPSSKRKQPAITVYGDYYSIDDMNISILTEAKNATRSGEYVITCSVNNSNYVVESIKTATYTLTGYYYVYYQVSNGKIYSERVEENKMPVGVTKKDIDAPTFSKISYSDDYKVTGEDIYVKVTLTDYSGLVYSAIFVGVFGVICLVYFIKKRESNVR